MPYLVDVEIKESPIGGRGAFAAQDIAAGTEASLFTWLWRFELKPGERPGKVTGTTVQPNRVWTREELEAAAKTMSADEIEEVLHGGYYHPPSDTFLELRDGSQFTNHSECPAITGSDSGEGELPSSDVCTARIDIKAGQELTDHYGFYASEDIKSWVDPLMQKYCPERLAFEATVKLPTAEEKATLGLVGYLADA